VIFERLTGRPPSSVVTKELSARDVKTLEAAAREMKSR